MSELVRAHSPADPLVAPEHNWSSTGRLVAHVTLEHQARWRWWIAFGAALMLIGVLAGSVGWLLYEGVGVWGNNIPVTWALDIVGYDWWIGVATGSLAVSSLLLLLGSEWRGAVNRLAETIALLGVCAAGLYPIIHLGRPWFFYWNLPYPNTFLLWPQFRSPLYWDAIDIVSFLGVAFLFWFTGLIPDLASMRDRAIERMEKGEGKPGQFYRRLKAQLYGIAALGWRGSVTHWQRWEHSYRAIAAMGLVVVLSLQMGAAVMFAGTVEPGWHDPMLPVAYIAGALLSGVAVTGTLLSIVRFVLPYKPLITPRHFALLGWLMLGLSLLFLYCDFCSFGATALFGNDYDRGVLSRRLHGDHAWATWCSVLCSVLPPQLFWIPLFRRSSIVVGLVGIVVAFGAWCDHFMLIVITLQHDFLPSAAHPYSIALFGMATFVGTGGLFLFLFLLVLRYVPVISIVNLRWLLPALPIRHNG
ncbi:MAG: NrfD/PsrC family molybdoenzyme membrane anchor subunit [Acetobacteraceae bacterium]|nr:NrfD/PsrC family molybdoenzyme membrane anchor subunit [Acetobacteraceae bacterium]